MLSVHLKKPFNELFSKTDFFIGDTILNEFDPELVEYITISEQERAFIEESFIGLPIRINDQTPFIQYFGDHAKFIVANWT